MHTFLAGCSEQQRPRRRGQTDQLCDAGLRRCCRSGTAHSSGGHGCGARGVAAPGELCWGSRRVVHMGTRPTHTGLAVDIVTPHHSICCHCASLPVVALLSLASHEIWPRKVAFRYRVGIGLDPCCCIIHLDFIREAPGRLIRCAEPTCSDLAHAGKGRKVWQQCDPAAHSCVHLCEHPPQVQQVESDVPVGKEVDEETAGPEEILTATDIAGARAAAVPK